MKNIKAGGKVHYAWKILVACCLINIAALGQTNSNGIFYPPICEELGFSLSALTLHTSFCGLTAALCALLAPKIFKKFNIKLVIGAGLALYQLSYMAMAFFHEVWQWCAASVVTGFAAALVWYIPVPMLINSWFKKGRKTALSITAVACGVSGIVMNLIFGKTITLYGWRLSYLLRGGSCLLLTIPVVWIVAGKPEDLGLEPYGAEGEEEAVKAHGGSGVVSAHGSELRVKTAFAVFLALALNFPCSMVTQLPSYATSIGLSLMVGSVLTSIAMVGNISSKAILGPTTEKFGIRVTGTAILVLIMIGFLALGFGASNTAVLYAAAFTTGITACANVLIVPNLLDTFVSGDDYVKVLSKCSSGTLFAGALKVTVTSLMFDIFGSFRPVFLAFAGLEVISILILVFVFRKKNHIRKEGKTNESNC